MYTRSFPSRRMPPDYGGTALVIGGQHTDEVKSAITDPTLDRRLRRPEEAPPERQTVDKQRPPFGILGQEQPQNVSETVSVSRSEVISDTETATASLLSLERLKSDDLLLLGLALLLFTDKNGDEGIPTDALMILAVLFFSGL